MEQEAEHVKLVEENNKLKHDRQISVSSVIVVVIHTFTAGAHERE